MLLPILSPRPELFAAVTAYTGTLSPQSIFTGQPLSSGSLLFHKVGNIGSQMRVLDTVRGIAAYTQCPGASSEQTGTDWIDAFTSTGIDLNSGADFNNGAVILISWLIRAGYVDVVTYTGTGSNTTVAHNLGVAPSFMTVFRRTSTNNHKVWHNFLTGGQYLSLSSDLAKNIDTTNWAGTVPTSSVFSVGTNADTNASGITYVAFLFADKAGFSKAGNYVGNGVSSGDSQAITGLGFKPRIVLVKNHSNANDWIMAFNDNGTLRYYSPNQTSTVALASARFNSFDSDGFTVRYQPGAVETNINGDGYIYMAWA